MQELPYQYETPTAGDGKLGATFFQGAKANDEALKAAIDNPEFGTFTTPYTSLSGNGALSLESKPTSTVVGTLIAVIFRNQTLEFWALISGSEPTGSSVQRPLDFNSVTNPKIWVPCN